MSLEQRVRSTLKDAGARIDTTTETPFPLTSPHSGRRRHRPILAFAAGFAAVLLFGVVAVLVSGDGADVAGDSPNPSGRLGSIVDLLPEGFDPEQAVSLLDLEGDPGDIATRYLESRLPLMEPRVAAVETQDGFTLVRWAWEGRDISETGWLVLRPALRGFEVVAATTDGIDMSNLALIDNAVAGVIDSSSSELIAADVLGLDGTPVDSAPHPDGSFPDATYLLGTAGAASPPLEVDVSVSGPVVVRVNRVGGTPLSVSEVILGSDTEGAEPTAGPPLTDEQFEEVFGSNDSLEVVRDSVFVAHTRDIDGPDLGWFGLYGAKAVSADDVDFTDPVDCIYLHGMGGEISEHRCGPEVTFDQPGVAITGSCTGLEVTMFSAWSINREVEHMELLFSDGSSQLLAPGRGHVIWAWEGTKQLVEIGVENASSAVHQVVDDYVSTLPADPCR